MTDNVSTLLLKIMHSVLCLDTQRILTLFTYWFEKQLLKCVALPLLCFQVYGIWDWVEWHHTGDARDRHGPGVVPHPSGAQHDPISTTATRARKHWYDIQTTRNISELWGSSVDFIPACHPVMFKIPVKANYKVKTSVCVRNISTAKSGNSARPLILRTTKITISNNQSRYPMLYWGKASMELWYWQQNVLIFLDCPGKKWLLWIFFSFA